LSTIGLPDVAIMALERGGCRHRCDAPHATEENTPPIALRPELAAHQRHVCCNAVTIHRY
jgi:hypothetical protein